jgi:hypothetical protein
MIQRMIVLNLVLLGFVVVGARQVRQDWRTFEATHQISAIQPASESIQALPAPAVAPEAANEDWTDIPSRNLFSFDRTDIPIVAQAELAKPIGPKPFLFGTMSVGQARIAMLGSGKPGARRSSLPMKLGDTIDGWRVVDIAEKAVTVEANAMREVVIMNDPTAEIPREHTRTLETGAGTAGVVQTGVSSRPSAPPSPSPSSTSAPASNANPAAPAPRMREIHTPFGTVRQPIEE